METSPFHKGELEAQKRAGQEKMARQVGRILSDQIPIGGLDFISRQAMVIVSTQDKDKNLWVSILLDKPGFVKSVDEKTLKIPLSSLRTSRYDPFWDNIEQNKQLAMLFIELSTRSRLRVNGSFSTIEDSLHLHVEQAFTNCPKYIQRRAFEVVDSKTQATDSKEQGESLSSDHINWIKDSDTFFVGSVNDSDHMDVSHRGGNPGFIKVLDQNTLKIPDYQGNNMFNTLGNFLVNPKAGLLFIDYQKGKTLHLTGKTDVIWEEGDTRGKGKAKRFWKFYISKWVQTESLRGVQWDFMDYSPFNPS